MLKRKQDTLLDTGDDADKSTRNTTSSGGPMHNIVGNQENSRNRVGLKNISIALLKNLCHLPDTHQLGKAIDDGGCFFDALAQCLNEIHDSTEYTEKVLRKLCYQYYYASLANKSEVNEWNKKDFGGIDQDEDAYSIVQSTKPELDKNFNARSQVPS